jgi:hypothetical protein
MEAVRLKQIDMDYRNHLQAWLTFCAKATKKNGKPVYNKFRKFYDYDKKIKEVTNKGSDKNRFAGIGKFLKKGE